MKKSLVFLLVVLAVSMFTSGSALSDEPIVVDEPDVRFEAELNLHFKTFSDYTLSDTYLERWLYKYNYLPGLEIMTDVELFDAIDLDWPGLESVKAAVEDGNYEEAKTALVIYFQNRTSPVYLDPYPLNPDSEQTYLERCEELLASPDFPNYEWDRERLGNGSKDAWWNWVSQLYYAYRYTGDMKHLNGLMDMFSFWYETVRPPAGIPRIWLTPSFINNPCDSHITSYRLHYISHINELLTEIGLDEIPTEERIPLYKSIVEHGRLIIDVNPGFRAGNIQICHMLRLLEAAIYFPEFKESQGWTDYAWDFLLRHAWLDLFDDGGLYERSAGYNNAVVRYWRRILELSRIAGLEEPDWLEPKLRNAQEWSMKVFTPILNLPPVGDGGMGGVDYAIPDLINGALQFPCPEFKFFVEDHYDQLEERAYELYGDKADDVLAELDAIESHEPDYTSVLLPDTGWAVMRSGWDRDARYMLFDYGSNEPWHAHRDGLGFSMFAYGQPLIIDSGHGGSYDSDRSKEWYKETISHNLVMINGMSQRKVTDGTCDRWVTSDTADYIDAIHEGYKWLGADCRRKITFVKPSYWIITDNLTEPMCQTTGFHECNWLAHFQPTELTIDETNMTVHTNNDDANALLVPSRPESLGIYQSEGWSVSLDGEVDDAPYIGYEREGDLPVDYEIIVYPYEGTDVPDVTVERLDLGADNWRCKGLEITTPEGVDYYLERLEANYYFVVDEDSNYRSYGEYSFDGEMALIRERDGEIYSIFLVGGGNLCSYVFPLVVCSGDVKWIEIFIVDDAILVNGDYTGDVTVMLPE